MGTWGSGNLDSDGALDIVAQRSSEMTTRIWKAILSKDSTEADESDYDELFINIDTVVALDSVGLFRGWKMPTPDEFDTAIRTWLDLWDDYFDGMGSTVEFKAERKGVIEDTFAKFRVVLVNSGS